MVKMIRTADDDGVDPAAEGRGKIGGRRGSGNRLGCFLGGFGYGVDAVDHANPIEIAVDAQVVSGHPAASDERYVDHLPTSTAVFFSRVA